MMGRSRKFRVGDVARWDSRGASYYGVVTNIRDEEVILYTLVNTDQHGDHPNWGWFETKAAIELQRVLTPHGRIRRNLRVWREAQ